MSVRKLSAMFSSESEAEVIREMAPRKTKGEKRKNKKKRQKWCSKFTRRWHCLLMAFFLGSSVFANCVRFVNQCVKDGMQMQNGTARDQRKLN